MIHHQPGPNPQSDRVISPRSPVALHAVGDSWYSEEIDGVVPLDQLLAGKRRRALVARSGVVRGLTLAVLSRRYDAVLVPLAVPGSLVLLAALALRGRRKAVVLEFIVPETGGNIGLRARARSLWIRFGLGWLVRRSVLFCHVLSPSEVDGYRRRLAAPADRFACVPFPMIYPRDRPSSEPRWVKPRGVSSTGRAACDWATLLSAAAGRDWPLTIVCGSADREMVEALGGRERATVRTDVSHAEHDAVVRDSQVYVLSLREDRVSSGHTRLRVAIQGGTPVVATGVCGLEGYLEDGVTARIVPPGDPSAMQSAIDELLDDPDRAELLARTAFERARGWTHEQYLEAIRTLVIERLRR